MWRVIRGIALVMLLQVGLAFNVLAVEPRGVACPNCNGGSLLETIGAPYNKSIYSPCPEHVGFNMVHVIKVRDRTVKCNRCGYSEHYTEQIGDGYVDFYCTSGKTHGHS